MLDIKFSNNFSKLAALFYAVVISTVTQYKIQSAEQDGFTGTGLTSECSKAIVLSYMF